MPLSGIGHHDVGVGGRFAGELLAAAAAARRARCGRRPGCRGARSRRARRRTGAPARAGTGWKDRSPLRSTTTSSPGSTSRTYSASIRSRAQVSEAMIVAPSSRPMTSGRKPQGSRAATSASGVRNRSEKAPITLDEAGGDRVLEPLAVAARVEVEDHLGVGGGLEDRAGRLQLLAQERGVHQVAVVAEGDRARGGSRSGSAARWPRRCRRPSSSGRGPWPGRRPAPSSFSSVKMSLTRPMPFSMRSRTPSLATIPADSWPRCCKRVQAEVGEMGGLRVAEDPEQAALVVEAVVVDRDSRPHGSLDSSASASATGAAA